MSERWARHNWLWFPGTVPLACSFVALILGGCSRNGSGTSENVPPPAAPISTGDTAQRSKLFCGNCHEDPSADVFPALRVEDEHRTHVHVFRSIGQAAATATH